MNTENSDTCAAYFSEFSDGQFFKKSDTINRIVNKQSVYKFCFYGMGMRWFVIALFALLIVPFSSAVVIFSDGFESGGLSGWNLTTGFNMFNWTANQTDPFQGSWHAQSRPQGLNTPPSTLQRTISTVTYNSINFSYYRKLVGIDPGDEFTVSWFDGVSWTVLETTDSNS